MLGLYDRTGTERGIEDSSTYKFHKWLLGSILSDLQATCMCGQYTCMLYLRNFMYFNYIVFSILLHLYSTTTEYLCRSCKYKYAPGMRCGVENQQ